MSLDGSDHLEEMKKADAGPVKKDLKYWTVGDYDWKYLCTPQVRRRCVGGTDLGGSTSPPATD